MVGLGLGLAEARARGDADLGEYLTALEAAMNSRGL